MQDKHWIYSLVDPRDGTVRYVGYSNNPNRRYREHCGGGYGCAVCILDWIKELREKKLRPLLFLIEETENWDIAVKREDYWIDFFLAEEEPLLNNVAPVRRSLGASYKTLN